MAGKQYHLPNFEIAYSTEAKNNYINSIGYLDTFKSELGSTLYDTINKLINSSGMYIYNMPGTQKLMIHAMNITGVNYDNSGVISKDPPYIFSSVKGNPSGQNNIIRRSVRSSIKNLYQHIRIVGDAFSLDTAEDLYQLVINKRYLCNTTVPKIKIATCNDADLSLWESAKTRETLVNNMIFKMKREFCTIKYLVGGHSYSGGVPYYPNSTCYVTDDFLPTKLKNRVYLVTGVEFTGDSSGKMTTELTMCLPIEDGDVKNEKVTS
jgi:hypothetical protein